MQESFNSFIQFATSAHPYVQALLVLAAACVVALIVLPAMAGIVKYLTGRTKTDVDDKLINALYAPVFYLVLLIGAIIALPLLSFPSGVTGVLNAGIQTLLVLVVAQGAVRVFKVMLQGAVQTHRLRAINTQTFPLFSNVLLLVVIAAALYAVFLVWGIDVTAWLASAGIIGIAVGFAAKDTLANLISGIFILADRPYVTGDYIVLGSGEKGVVSAVGLRSTRIHTFDDEEVIIPNAVIANDTITNKTRGPQVARLKVDVGVAYGTDTAQVEEILMNIARDHELVLDDPAPAVRFMNFGDSSLDFSLLCRVQDPLTVAKTASEIRREINERFAEVNIEIPFPQRDVNLKK